MPMTGDLLQAARVLTGLSVDDLAARSGVPARVVGRFEDSGEGEVDVGAVAQEDVAALSRLRTTLEQAGVEFLDDGTPGVRLRPGTSGGEEGIPVEEVTTQNDV
jgi:phosphoserine phosphatase